MAGLYLKSPSFDSLHMTILRMWHSTGCWWNESSATKHIKQQHALKCAWCNPKAHPVVTLDTHCTTPLIDSHPLSQTNHSINVKLFDPPIFSSCSDAMLLWVIGIGFLRWGWSRGVGFPFHSSSRRGWADPNESKVVRPAADSASLTNELVTAVPVPAAAAQHCFFFGFQSRFLSVAG